MRIEGYKDTVRMSAEWEKALEAEDRPDGTQREQRKEQSR
jgi:hypothetical protein